MDALTFILQSLSQGNGLRALDIGCGRGGLAKPIRQAGIRWLGLDPDSAAVEHCAKAGYPVVRADGRALPFPDMSFEAAIFLNSLHHLPIALMDTALADACRVARKVIIVEPRAHGDLADALRPIDDETEVRLAAQASIARCHAAGAKLACEEEWTRIEHFADFGTFVKRMIAAERTRADPARIKRTALERAFASAAVGCGTGGFRLSQPMIGHLLSRA
jgi:SAM-dependent methyltransferase